jgi:hypothetical protein
MKMSLFLLNFFILALVISSPSISYSQSGSWFQNITKYNESVKELNAPKTGGTGDFAPSVGPGNLSPEQAADPILSSPSGSTPLKTEFGMENRNTAPVMGVSKDCKKWRVEPQSLSMVKGAKGDSFNLQVPVPFTAPGPGEKTTQLNSVGPAQDQCAAEKLKLKKDPKTGKVEWKPVGLPIPIHKTQTKQMKWAK